MNIKKNFTQLYITILIYMFSYQLVEGYPDAQTSTNENNLNIELFSGNTMGTTYHIKVVMDKNEETPKSTTQKSKALHTLIEEKLKQVNQSMSVYIPDSEISLFNKADKGEIIKISSDFNDVMVKAQKIYTITEGAWDGTVKPLVDLWGFGTKKEITDVPSSENIRVYLQTIGFNQININTQNKTLQKQNAAITLDLGSIAKGFGVDAVAQLLKSEGYSNFLVEIGGEVFASGKKSVAKHWMVGISKPNKGVFTGKEESMLNAVYDALPLQDKSLATSGDYRNFTIIEGKTYSHIINPTTGYPVDNGVVSASVIADNCTFADGLATALMVMGHEKGVNLVNSLENVECLILVKDKYGVITEYKSNTFVFKHKSR
ncbi:MAG: FAD:protein FMN transferase [Desulfamplus sp.]|nr:FAD:protein FMN transferase [Desulfamplus sp.]